jgi:predicted RND superfamily exporter protein
VGAIVLFGILGAMIVSLTFLPALTSLVLSFSEARRTRSAAAPAGAVGRPAE